MTQDHSWRRDMDYEYKLLERINRARVDGVPISDIAIFGSYSYWHRFQQFIFSSDIVRFAAYKSSFDAYLLQEGGHDAPRSAKGFLVSALGMLISALCVCVGALIRPSIVLFGIDRVSGDFASDFRTKHLHSFLRARKIRYQECLHTVFNKKFLQNMFIRRRPVLYLESLDTLYAILRFFRLVTPFKIDRIEGLDGLSDDEAKFARYVIKKYLGQYGAVTLRVKVLSWYLRLVGARAVWAIDDTRHYHDICLAAHRAGIPSYAFQHGHITRFHVGWLTLWEGGPLPIRPDFLVVWSSYWKQELVRLKSVFPIESILIGTQPKQGIELPQERMSSVPTILIPHETDSPKEEVSKVIAMLSDLNYAVILKLRKDHSIESQLSLYPSVIFDGKRVSYVTQLAELSETPCAAIGVYSTFLYEMVEAFIPVGVLIELSLYGEGMVQNRLAAPVRLSSLKHDIEKLIQSTNDELLQKKETLTAGEQSLEATLDHIWSTLSPTTR